MKEDEQVKEVYAHFGLAIYLAQVLEHGIVNCLVLSELIPSRRANINSQDEWIQELDSFCNLNFERTLGQLIKFLTVEASIPVDLEKLLRNALLERNRLAHRFFREKVKEFLIQTGREKMIEELITAQELFVKADKSLDVFIRPLREKYGITDEYVNTIIDEMLRRKNNKG